MKTIILLLLLLLLLALQPTVGFSLLSDFLPFCPFFTLLTPPSYSHYLKIFINACNPSLPSACRRVRTYQVPNRITIFVSLLHSSVRFHKGSPASVVQFFAIV
jgi:hypothetical protein